MNKTKMAAMMTSLRTLTTEHLQESVVHGIAIAAAYIGNRKTLKQVVTELFVIKKELKRRNIKAVKVHTPMGLAVDFLPLPDLKAKGPVLMTIPSPTELIEGKVATDLPRHGYLTVYLP